MEYGKFCRNCGFHKSGLKICPKCDYEENSSKKIEHASEKKTISPIKAAFFSFIGLPGLIHFSSLKKRKKGSFFMFISLSMIILVISSFVTEYMKHFDKLLNVVKTSKGAANLSMNTSSLDMYFYILIFWWFYVSIDAFITAKKINQK
jgi:hypothetical protein